MKRTLFHWEYVPRPAPPTQPSAIATVPAFVFIGFLCGIVFIVFAGMYSGDFLRFPK